MLLLREDEAMGSSVQEHTPLHSKMKVKIGLKCEPAVIKPQLAHSPAWLCQHARRGVFQ